MREAVRLGGLSPGSIDLSIFVRNLCMRIPRQLRPGARYSVTARANRKEMLLDPDSIKELFLSVVRRAHKKYAFRIDNFCIMGNHIHFLIKPVHGECLSSIMQWILGVFAMAYNKKTGLTGHVWGDRFYSRIIQDRHDFLRVFEYIDMNPVRAHCVARPEDWLYGGVRHALDGRIDIVAGVPIWAVGLASSRLALRL